MVSVGGALDVQYSQCDWEKKGVSVFDMTNATWSSSYYNVTPDYEMPTAVATTVGATPGAKNVQMSQPAGGFDQRGLADLFSTISNGSSAGNGTSSQSTTASKDRRREEAIIAGVLGGVSLVGFGLAAWFYFRQRLRHWWPNQPWKLHEIDGKARKKTSLEIMSQDRALELPINEKPIEMPCPEPRRPPVELESPEEAPPRVSLPKKVYQLDAGSQKKIYQVEAILDKAELSSPENLDRSDRRKVQQMRRQRGEEDRKRKVHGQRQAWI